MFKISDRARDKTGDFLLDLSKYLITGALLVEVFNGFKGSQSIIMISGITAAALFIGGFFIFNRAEMKGD